MELRIYIRQRQDRDSITGQQVYYSGLNPYSLQKVTGTLPAARQWKQGGQSVFGKFIDVTDEVSDLHKFKMTWTTNRGVAGVDGLNGRGVKKQVGANIEFEGEAYRLIKQWLFDDISAPLNTIEVEVKHVGCGTYTDLMISADRVNLCDGEVCTMNLSLKQIDESLVCIQRTLITDNWQGWFGETRRPSSGKQHPRFSYCNEARPNGMLIMQWWLMTQLSSIMFLLVISFLPIWNSVVWLIVSVLKIVNKIINAVNSLGFNIQNLDDIIDKLEKSIVSGQDVKDIFKNFFVESAGCGREHPAPLIRDYISNVCSKCGVTVNGNTAPIFFSNSWDLETSYERDTGGQQTKWNPYYNACYLAPVSAKGVRRFKSLNIFSGAVKNTTDFWLPESAPLHTLDTFLDELGTLFNTKWIVENNTLYIDRKDILRDNVPVFDFTNNHPDKNLLVTGICSEWNGETMPTHIRGIYTSDAADTAGNEAMGQQNGIINFGTTDNPMYSGSKDITTRFAAARFRFDGAAEDYIFDALQQITNLQFIGVAPWTPAIVRDALSAFALYADYALLITHETTTLPKILIWDGQGDDGYLMNCKAVRQYSAVSTVANSGPVPSPNPRYNNYGGIKSWSQLHEPQDEVLGNRRTTFGEYVISPTLGGVPVTTRPVWLVNYPMYFAPEFQGGLWDNFHWIDDPNFNPKMRREWTAKIELCCDALKRLEVFGNGYKIRLDAPVKLPFAYYQDGRITEISVNYPTDDMHGAHIEIKGIA